MPALLQFAERYQRRAGSRDRGYPIPESQKPASGRFKLVKRAHSATGAVAKDAARERDSLEQQQAALQSLQQELTALRVASSLTAADKPTPAPDLSALSDFASGVRQAQPDAAGAQGSGADRRSGGARKSSKPRRDRRIALLEQRLAALPEQADKAWQKLAAAKTTNDKARQRYEQDKSGRR